MQNKLEIGRIIARYLLTPVVTLVALINRLLGRSTALVTTIREIHLICVLVHLVLSDLSVLLLPLRREREREREKEGER